MAERSAGHRRSSRTAIILWLVPPLFELPVVLMLAAGFPEVAEKALFGSPGTEFVLGAALVTLVAGAAVAWLSVAPPALRAVVGGASFVVVGLVIALLVGFLTSGAGVIVAVLLAHSALSIAMIGGAVVRGTATMGRRPT